LTDRDKVTGPAAIIFVAAQSGNLVGGTEESAPSVMHATVRWHAGRGDGGFV
jgi:hypothetical protein